MKRYLFVRLIFLTAIGLVGSPVVAQQAAVGGVIISEFKSLNIDGLEDEKGQPADWVELLNATPDIVNLHGWGLTDDPELPLKWVFPDVELAPGQFLVVFASGRNLASPDADLHTNFRLERQGEFLGLASPEGDFVHAFAPAYPRQVRDASYGVVLDIDSLAAVSPGGAVKYLIPQTDELGFTWTDPDFDDSGWGAGTIGIGFDLDDDPEIIDLIETDVAELMYRVNPVIYLRFDFDLTEADLSRAFRLRVQTDGGFAAYLNGTEVLRFNTREPLEWDRPAQRRRQPELVRQFVEFSLDSAPDLLRPGKNVLAVHAANNSSTSDDFVFVAGLEGITLLGTSPGAEAYFQSPTPGWFNRESRTGIAAAPEASRPTGAYVAFEDLELTTDDPETLIRFTTDGSEPHDASPVFDQPLTIDRATTLRTRGFKPGHVASEVKIFQYVVIAGRGAVGFTSNLPIVVISTFGNDIGSGGCDHWTDGNLLVIEPDESGVSSLNGGEVNFIGRAGFTRRGSSSGGREKLSMTIELQEESAVAVRGIIREGVDKAASILGLPSESDWVLWGPENFDRALMRNPLIYDLSNQVGEYATRHRFVEVILNRGRGPIGVDIPRGSRQHYWGVYAFMEKIKRDGDRVPVERLTTEQNSEPDITGGYIFKVDRAGCDSSITTGTTLFRLIYPNEPSQQQKEWLSRWLTGFFGVLNGDGFADPEEGYRKYIDVPSWIDHHMLNMLAMNVDAFRLSGYMYKFRDGPNGGKFHMGPIWDFDRSMESTDSRDDNPRAWAGSGDSSKYFQRDPRYPWYARVLEDPAFREEYRARWSELRAGALSTENIHATIDSMADELRFAQQRNFRRWPSTRPRFGSWQKEVDHLKDWLQTRSEWVDAKFLLPPEFSREPGPYEAPFDLELAVSSGDAWYTVNGPDPLDRSTRADPAALRYTGPIRVEKGVVRIRARTRVGESTWSDMVQGIYFDRLAPLVVTEVMYNPNADNSEYRSTDLEFVEFQNVGDEVLDLSALELAGRARFKFGEGLVTTLRPGEFVVLAHDLEAFTSRYGDEGILIAGEFGGGSLNNTRHEIRLEGPLGEVHQSFEYLDDWVPTTDGVGYSLVIRNARGPREAWKGASGWRRSREIDGSPGRADGEEGRQIPGDLNQDSRVNVSDAIAVLRVLFSSDDDFLPCRSEAANTTLVDINGDATFNIADAVALLEFIFRRGHSHALGVECTAISTCPEVCF